MQHLSLICEGPCNPAVREVDAIVADERNTDGCREHELVTKIPNHVATLQRGLVHTPHQEMGSFYACTVCGCVRIF